ncbi:heavy metal translocating P-type ATPase [Caviibacter abscessus]|uniref:heavy metal translocating P-type ATPase n=1 Tax=Caviibacter abscessus TaxID=1766719 RepID=UPI0008343D7B|nr:heavy metal translocating P-type ATPase [Caviibacter abscessus]
MEKKYLLFLGWIVFFCAFITEFIQKYFYLDTHLYFFYTPLYILAYAVIGLPILIKAYISIEKKDYFSEYILMTISTIAAFIIGAFEESSAVMVFYTMGEYFLENSKRLSNKNIENLLKFKVKTVDKINNKNSENILVEKIKKGDEIIVKVGEQIPIDGFVINQGGYINQAVLSGESKPKEVVTGDIVYAGSINLTNILKIKVINEYTDSTLYKLYLLTKESLNKKTKVDEFITSFAKWYTPIVILLSILILIIPTLFFQNVDVEKSIYNSIVLLIVACPCALVLAIPLTYVNAITNLAKEGIHIKNINIFDKILKINTLYLDKTGTLTTGQFEISKIEVTNEEILEYIYVLQKYSNHPISKSIVKYLKYIKTDKTIINYEEISGLGLRATIDNHNVLIGNRKLMVKNNISVKDNGSIYVAIDNVIVGNIYVFDKLKNDSIEAIDMIRSSGIKEISMLTGDNKEQVEKIKKSIHLDNYFYELLPEQKLKLMENKDIIFVGDGINDAPAIAKASVGIAMGISGSDMAIESADVVFNNESLKGVAYLKNISKEIKSIIYQNISIIIFVKAIIIILGMLGSAKLWLAVFGDVGVSFVAMLNIKRMKKFR